MKNLPIALGIALVYLGLHFFTHIHPRYESMLSFSEGKYQAADWKISQAYLNDVVAYHKELPAFQKRPIITQLSSLLGGPENQGLAWLILNYLGLLSLSLAILLGKTLRWKEFLLFGLSFPVLFSFFPPIYSYEDLWQWTFLVLCFRFREKPSLSIAFFILACLVRETSLILIPFWILLETKSDSFFQRYLKIPLIAGILGGIAVFLLWSLLSIEGAKEQEGWAYRIQHFSLNFFDANRSKESIHAFFLTGLLPFLLLKKPSKRTWIWVGAFLLNALLIFLFAKARESRLFLLPMVFLWAGILPFRFPKVIKVPRGILGLILLFSGGITWILMSNTFHISIGTPSDSPFEIYAYIYYFTSIVLIGTIIHKQLVKRELN